MDVALKGGWRIRKAKRHDQVLVEAVSGTKCRLPLISFLDANSIISVFDIQFGKELGS